VKVCARAVETPSVIHATEDVRVLPASREQDAEKIVKPVPMETTAVACASALTAENVSQRPVPVCAHPDSLERPATTAVPAVSTARIAGSSATAARKENATRSAANALS